MLRQTNATMGDGRTFSRCEPVVNFSRKTQFFSRVKDGEISFFPLETKQTIMFCRNFIRKNFRFQNPWTALGSPVPTFDAYDYDQASQ